VKEIYVLDACALLAVLKDEPGADKVAAVYAKADAGEAQLVINKINLLEVYYGFYRAEGQEYAENILATVRKSIVIAADFTDDIFNEAGRLKACYHISLADSIALAQASVSGGRLLTSDHHEFDCIEAQEQIRFEWIR
jgi:PIN domain nuclease of toxin-antitoxin system